jgi:hypothetical protein
MKVSTMLIALIAFCFTCCQSNIKTDNLPGKYVNKTVGEYAIDFDTLEITPQNTSAYTYLINSNTGFQRIKNGEKLPMEYKNLSWTATWDENKQTLSESDLGRQIVFKPSDHSLVLKNSIYKKIK